METLYKGPPLELVNTHMVRTSKHYASGKCKNVRPPSENTLWIFQRSAISAIFIYHVSRWRDGGLYGDNTSKYHHENNAGDAPARYVETNKKPKSAEEFANLNKGENANARNQ